MLFGVHLKFNRNVSTGSGLTASPVNQTPHFLPTPQRWSLPGHIDCCSHVQAWRDTAVCVGLAWTCELPCSWILVAQKLRAPGPLLSKWLVDENDEAWNEVQGGSWYFYFAEHATVDLNGFYLWHTMPPSIFREIGCFQLAPSELKITLRQSELGTWSCQVSGNVSLSKLVLKTDVQATARS